MVIPLELLFGCAIHSRRKVALSESKRHYTCLWSENHGFVDKVITSFSFYLSCSLAKPLFCDGMFCLWK